MSTAAPWLTSKTDEQQSSALHIELVDGSIVTLRLGNWDATVRVDAIFRLGHFQDPATGTFWAASQIKRILLREKHGNR
jgi:hypothetical protein